MSNSLASMCPELVREWSDRNLPLTPDKITYGSNKIIWWKADCGHEWQTSVKARSSGEKCPICSGARVVCLVLEAMTNNLRANIMRMGQLTNRVADGVFQKNYESNAFLKRLKAMLDLGVIPENLQTQYTEFTPIDKAANAVMTIVRYFNNEQTVFHIENDKFVSIQELTAMFNELNYSVKSISQTAFANLIKDIASDPSKKYILETFINELDENNRLSYESSIHIDLNFTKTYLHMLGFEWSDINVDYLRKYVGYFRKIGYFK